VTVRTSQLRAIAHRRSLAVLAAALVIAGCAAPNTQQSQALSGSEAATPSASAVPTTPAPTSSPTPAPTASPPTSSSATFNLLPPKQPADFVSQITCSGSIGVSDPVAIVQLHAVKYTGDVVLRDYADPGTPRTACTFGTFAGNNQVVQLIDARHVVIDVNAARGGHSYAVVDLPEVRFHWFQLNPGLNPRFAAISPGLDQVAWLTADQAGGTDKVHITTTAGDHVVASLPDPHLGRCGGPDDSKAGAYTHSGAHLFILNQPISNLNSLVVVEGETAVLSVLPPSAGWPQGAHPAMAVWSPTSETLYYRKGSDVWKWTAGSDPQPYLPGVNWSYPTITPDGGHLAYTAASPDGTPDTYLIDLAHGGSPQMIGKGARTSPVFLNSTQLWFKPVDTGCISSLHQPLIYNIADGSEAPSIIDHVIAVWPSTSSNF
jgi:hypothetical protein